jgi:hypothetical protein
VPQYSRRVARGTAHSQLDCAELSAVIPGRAIAENGDPDRGIASAMQALAAMQAIQSRHFLWYLLGLLADACPKAGRHAAAMKAVEDGLVLAEATGERFYSAELHRLHGEPLARPRNGQKRKAQASFPAVIKVAKRQGATAFERGHPRCGSSHQRARPRRYKKQWLKSQTEDAGNRHEAIFDQERQTGGAARADATHSARYTPFGL